MSQKFAVALALCLAAGMGRPCAAAADGGDWPQFMRDAAHTGDAADEVLRLPLGLAVCVQLDDAVFSSPAVVGGRVFAVDQMGTAYAVDPKANKVIWRAAPDGDDALGGNTGAPCVVKDKVYYGTTAGRVHTLDARDGKKIASVDVGSAIPGSLTYANDSLYFQTLEAQLIRMSLDGRILWTHDHRRDYKWTGRPADWPHGYHKDQYGGGEVAVSGKRVVASIGCDQLCLEDLGDTPKIVWCNRSYIGQMGPAIRGEWVYFTQPHNDGQGAFFRVRLADGTSDPKVDRVEKHWLPLATPAVREQTVFVQSHSMGMQAYDFAQAARKWKAFDNVKWKEGFTPGVASPALSRDHCVFATVRGEIYVVDVNSAGDWKSAFKPEPFRFATASGKFIASAPVIAGGMVYFGSDDGRLYGLASGGALNASEPARPIHAPRSKLVSATGKDYFLSGPYGDPANTCTVDDPGLKPPFRVRWVAPSQATFKQPLVAGETDVFFSSLEGTVAAYEQATGRLRWRRRVDGPGWCRQGLSYANGCLFVPRPGGVAKTNTATPRGPSQVHCLDAADGSTRWSAPLGGSPDELTRLAPISVGDVVVYPTLRKGTLTLQAWVARTGAPAWDLDLGDYRNQVGVSGCVLDGKLFFSCRGGENGQTVAIEPATGKVLWRNTECVGDRNLAGRDGKLIVIRQDKAMYCLSAKDGSLLWKNEEKYLSWRYALSFGSDLLAGRKVIGWSRTNEAYRTDTGRPVREGGKPMLLSAGDHGCGPLVLVSSGITLSTATSGLFAIDATTGAPLWNSPGFGSSICTNPAVANGRCFVNPQFSGRLYCFEPRSAASASSRPVGK